MFHSVSKAASKSCAHPSPSQRIQAEENAAAASNLDRRVAFRPPPIGESRSNTAATHDSGTNLETYMRLNVGGKSYFVRAELYTSEWTRMHELLDSTHEDRLKMVDGFDAKTGEYYLERNTKLTDHVMDFFVTGSLHKPQNVCVERFKEELEYWKIKSDQLSTCCKLPNEHHSRQLSRGTSFNEDDYVADFDGACFATGRLAMWRFLEDPQSSLFAAIFALLSVFFVFASVVGLILGSMPEFQADSSNAAAYHVMHVKSRPNDLGNKFGNDEEIAPNELLKDFVYKPTDSPNLPLTILEYICIGWFTFEYLVRYQTFYYNMFSF
uniref:BTB_2 domain-containing protein n=1 Tax=Caenorhabditis japonica TaxID=281687 RepID=A0A8R1HN93_CAEJA